MTNHWVDIKNADVILIMGGNAAEAHPCGFKWVTEAKAHNKARLIVVDPRFTRRPRWPTLCAPIRTGTDIVFLGGVINYLLTNDKIQHEYVKNYTDMSFIVREDFAFNDGIYPATTPRSARTTSPAGTTSAATTASSRPTRRCSIRAASTTC
jgi:formate dehydrogenase major subunit